MESTVGESSSGSRRKQKRLSQRQQSVIKRYSDKDVELANFRRPCQHNSRRFQCSQITLNDVKTARKKFYETPNKIEKDKRLLIHLSTREVQRKRREILEDQAKQNLFPPHII